MTSSVSDNQTYPMICEDAATKDYIFKMFKSIEEYQYVLEHTTPELGREYFDFIRDNHDIDTDVIHNARVNDILGKPQIYPYEFGLFSPSTLKYAKVAFDLLAIFPNLQEKKIIEIGGGYGGQCAVLNSFIPIKQYTILDLREACMLQTRYLNTLKVQNFQSIPYSNIDIENFECDLVISNYGLNECTLEWQEKYFDKIISKSPNGYLTINTSTQFNEVNTVSLLLKCQPKVKIFKEKPVTNEFNVICFWREENA